MTDPISDFLTRLRNASKAGLAECASPHSKLRASIAAILKAEGYVADFKDGADAQGHKTLVVTMKYVAGAPAITGLVRVSTPGRRVYSGSSELPRVRNGLGITIVSTPRGVLSDAEAREHNVGGEVLAEVF